MVNSLLLAILLSTGYENGNKHNEYKKTLNPDTTNRPANISKQATLINFGGDDMPVLVWVEYVGPLIDNGKEYSHIQGIKFSYVKQRRSYTEYYENQELRSTARKFNFKASRVLEFPGEANIHLVNGKDSILMFHVLGNESRRVHRGMEFKNMSTISLNEFGEYVADTDMEFNIKRDDKGMYILTLNNGSRVMYKNVSMCKVSEESVSFLDRENGRIYLLDRRCYLELVNKDDAKKFQELR